MTDSAPLDPYRVLGVAPTDPPDRIRGAYRAILVENHPDRNNDPAATRRFQAATEAWRRLQELDGRLAGGVADRGGPTRAPLPPHEPEPRGEPPILSWRNVSENFRFCMGALGRITGKLTAGDERTDGRNGPR